MARKMDDRFSLIANGNFTITVRARLCLPCRVLRVVGLGDKLFSRFFNGYVKKVVKLALWNEARQTFNYHWQSRGIFHPLHELAVLETPLY